MLLLIRKVDNEPDYSKSPEENIKISKEKYKEIYGDNYFETDGNKSTY